MSRAQLNHLLLDVDFLNNPKVRALKAKFKIISQLCLIDLYLSMSRATNARIDGDCLAAIVSEYELGSDFISYCIEKGLIHKEGSEFSNSRIAEDQEKLGSTQDKWREKNGKKRVAPSLPRVNPDLPRVNPDSLNVQGSELLNIEELNKDIKKNGHAPDYSHYPPDQQEKIIKADSMLAPIDDPEIQHSSQFINAGRRPMRDYREIWLTPQELVCVLDEFFDLNLEPKYRKKVFRKVASGISTKCASSGMSPDRISAFNWLTGFELTNTLAAVKAEKDLQRSETYLNNARGANVGQG